MLVAVTYSNSWRAKEGNLPLRGSLVEVNTIIELDQLADLMKSAVILHPSHYSPSWAEYAYLDNSEEAENSHTVYPFPDNWRQWRWIEVYNGYRE